MTDTTVSLSKVHKNAFAGAIGNVMEWYDFAPVYYLMGLGVLSLIAVLSIPETRGRPLRE